MSKELREAMAEEAMFPHGAVNVTGIASGFDRNNADTMGQMEYCISAETHDYWRIDKDGVGTLIESTTATTFSDGTALADRTLVHFPTSGQANFSYWYQGGKIVKTTTQSVQITADSGLYVFYNSSGVLTEQTTESGHDLIVDETLISYISTHTYAYFADERHGIVMDGETHYTLHYSTKNGFAHHAGGDIAGIADGVGTHGAITNAGYFDEDIHVSVTGDPREDATIHMINKFGATNDWFITAAASTLIASMGGAVPSWNEFDTTWKLTPFTTGYSYTTFWATNNVIHPVVKMMGQSHNSDRKEIRRRIEQEIMEIKTTGLPAPEMMMFAAVIIDGAGDCYKGADKENWIDYRQGFPVDRY